MQGERGVTRLTLERALAHLPDLDALRPLLHHLIARSTPNASRQWTASGALGTVDGRLVDALGLDDVPEQLAEAVRDHLTLVYRHVVEYIRCLEARDGLGAATSLLGAAALEEASDRPDRAEVWAAAAYSVATDFGMPTLRGLALRRRARALGAQGNLEPALDAYRAAFHLANDSFDAQGAIEAAIGEGNILDQQGRWAAAAGRYRTALSLIDAGGVPDPQLLHAQYNLHLVLLSVGEIQESQQWLERATQSARDLAVDTAPSFLANAWGQIFMARGRFGRAERRFLEGVALESENSQLRVSLRLNLAEALLAQGRTLDASIAAREAELDALTSSRTPQLPEVYRMLGRITSAQHNPDAFVFFEKAVELVRDLGLPPLEEALTLQEYAAHEARSGDAASASRLYQSAEHIYADLGLRGKRRTYGDVLAPRRERQSPAGD